MFVQNKYIIISILFYLTAIFSFGQNQVRLKDIAYIQGVRENQLSGFGLVSGLSGKGDASSSVLLQKILSNLFASFDLVIPAKDIKSKNCAAVMITADIPPFVREGDRIDITLSSVGDAKSLEGGVLLQTNLQAANGTVYAVAQGKIIITERNSAYKTVAYIPDGAIVEKNVLSTFTSRDFISVVLFQEDFNTANEVSKQIKKRFPEAEVKAEDATMVRIKIPESFKTDSVNFISLIEHLEITPDMVAKIVVNPRSGIVVMGKEVKIGKVAVSYQGDKISIGNSFQGAEDRKEQFIIDELTTVDQLVTLMQGIGISTPAIIEILKAIDKAGALYGKLIVM